MLENSNCYIDLHILQTLSPECIKQNPLTGRPDTVIGYDGVNRARVSHTGYEETMKKTLRDTMAKEKAECLTDRNACEHIMEAISVSDAISTHGVKKLDPVTIYRFATISVHELAENLSDDIIGQIVREIAEAFIVTMPDGQRNPSAYQEADSMIYVAVRDDRSVSFGGAFEESVKPYQGGYLKPSEDALAERIKRSCRYYIPEPKAAFVCGGTGSMSIKAMGRQVTVKELLDSLEQDVNDYLNSSKEAVQP